MSNRCRVCQHPQRPEIEASLRSGVSVRQVAARFGVSRSAIDRHTNNGHSTTSIALSGDVEVIQDVPTFRDPGAQVEALKEATLSSFNHMRRRGDDPVAIAYLKEFRALVALGMDIADRRGGKDHDPLDAMRQKIASENRQYLTAVEERRALDAIKAKLTAHIADRKAEAAAPVIDLSPAAHPPVISVENAPPASPVRKRMRHIPAKI